MAAAGEGAGSGFPLEAVRVLKGHSGPVNVAKFNCTGQYVLSGGSDKTVKLFNPYRKGESSSASTSTSSAVTPSGLEIATYKGHGYEVSDIAITKDNSKFVSCGGDKCAFLWDTGTGSVVRKLFGHDQRLNSVSLSEDGGVLLTASDDKTVKCWDLKSHSRVPFQTLSDFKDNVTRVFAGRSEIVASSMDGFIRCYDIRAASLLEDAVGAPVSSMALTHDGCCYLAASAKEGGKLLLLDRSAGASSGGQAAAATAAGIPEDAAPLTVLNTYRGHCNSYYRIMPCVSADDSCIACGGEDGSLHLWDVVSADAGHASLASAHKRAIACVSEHPSLRACTAGGGAGQTAGSAGMLVTASLDGTAKLWAPPGLDLADFAPSSMDAED